MKGFDYVYYLPQQWIYIDKMSAREQILLLNSQSAMQENSHQSTYYSSYKLVSFYTICFFLVLLILTRTLQLHFHSK